MLFLYILTDFTGFATPAINYFLNLEFELRHDD